MPEAPSTPNTPGELGSSALFGLTHPAAHTRLPKYRKLLRDLTQRHATPASNPQQCPSRKLFEISLRHGQQPSKTARRALTSRGHQKLASDTSECHREEQLGILHPLRSRSLVPLAFRSRVASLSSLDCPTAHDENCHSEHDQNVDQPGKEKSCNSLPLDRPRTTHRR